MPRRDGKNDDDKARATKRAAAHSTALGRLAYRNHQEFLELYREELAKRGLDDHPLVAERTS